MASPSYEEIPPAQTREVFLWGIRRRRRYRVVNRSMEPLLHEGDEVLATNGGEPKPGEIWVLRHPSMDLKIIKLVEEERDAQGYWVVGLNPEQSQDSREFGVVPTSHFLGRVTCVWYRKSQ